jgi:oligopeptide/dipeptide ABC transporter ATP-binding protein
MAALLEVDRLVTSRGQTALVDGISFSLSPGRMLGLVGESGCGKSLTALSIMGLLPTGVERTSGEVRLLGAPISAADRGRQVAMVFQEPATALNPVLTIGAQIAETLQVHLKLSRAAAKAKGVELLRAVGIADAAERFDAWPHQLSGGMRQRVLIAAAIACDPRVLIADEPTTALDVTVQAQILALLSELKRQRGLAVLLITHDLGVVAEACDDVAVMYAGRLAERGTVNDLLLHPRHPYTGALLAARPGLATRGRDLEAIAGAVPPPELRPTGCAFADRCSRALPVCVTIQPTLPPGDAPGFACHHPL